MASLQLHDRGIHRVEDVPLSIGEAVGGGASSGSAVVVRLALPFNALTTIAPLSTLEASTSPDNSLPPSSEGDTAINDQSENYDNNTKSSNSSSKLPNPVASAPLFLHLTHLDVRHNKLKSLHGVSALPLLKSLLAFGNRGITSLEPLLKPAGAATNGATVAVLPCLEALWLTGCGLVATELARLLDAAPLPPPPPPPPPLVASTPQLPVPQAYDNASKNRASKTHQPPVVPPTTTAAQAGSVATALPTGRVGFRLALRVLSVKGCPLSADPSCSAVLSLTFPELAFLDGRPVASQQPQPQPSAHVQAVTWAHSLDGNLAIHRLRHSWTLQQEDSTKRAKRSSSSSSKSHGNGSASTSSRSNRGSSSSGSDKCDETRLQDEVHPTRGGLCTLDETAAGPSADDKEEGVEQRAARRRRRQDEDENREADKAALTPRDEHADLVADLGANATTADEGNSTTGAANEEAEDDESASRSKEVTLANCMDGLSSELEQMLGLPPKRKPKAPTGTAKNKSSTTTARRPSNNNNNNNSSNSSYSGQEGGGDGGVSGNEVESNGNREEGVDSRSLGDGDAPSKRTVSAAVAGLTAAAPCTVYYARHSHKAGRRAAATAQDAQQPIVTPLPDAGSSSSSSRSSSTRSGNASGKQQQQQQLGPQAVSLRSDGSCTVKWPSGSTAACFERCGSGLSSSAFTLSAFFDNGGGLAVMLDARGYGSANYLSGATALTCSPTSGTGSSSSGSSVGFARSPSGETLVEWSGNGRSSGACDRSTDGSGGTSNSNRRGGEEEVQLDLGGGLGLIYAPPREASRVDGGGGTLFFQHRGVKLALSQKAKCAAFLPPNSHLFGIQHDDQNVESGARRDGRGSRSRAEAAKDLPPLTHSDLIEQLRSATAGL